MAPKPSGLLGGALEILTAKIEQGPVADKRSEPIHQQDMIDGGVIGLDVGTQHEAVRRQQGVDLPHRRFGTAVTFDMGAARRHRQHRRQHDAQRLQDHRIAGRPQVDFLAIFERDPGQQREAEAPGSEVVVDRLTSSEVICARSVMRMR